MAKKILTNVRVFAGAVDLTTMNNQVTLEAQAETKDVTTFGSTDANGVLWKESIPVIDGANISVGGFWEAGAGTFVDDDMWAQFGGAGPWSALAEGAAEGNMAYLLNATRTQYSLLDAVREVAPFKAAAVSTGAFAHGGVLLAPGTARIATGSGGVVQLGAVTAGRSMRAALHVVSIAGTTPTLAVTLQSAALVGFGSPTTRATFTTVSLAAGNRTSEWVSSAVGPITDQFWRMSYTITGAGPSYLVLGTAGIA